MNPFFSSFTKDFVGFRECIALNRRHVSAAEHLFGVPECNFSCRASYRLIDDHRSVLQPVYVETSLEVLKYESVGIDRINSSKRPDSHSSNQRLEPDVAATINKTVAPFDVFFEKRKLSLFVGRLQGDLRVVGIFRQWRVFHDAC